MTKYPPSKIRDFLDKIHKQQKDLEEFWEAIFPNKTYSQEEYDSLSKDYDNFIVLMNKQIERLKEQNLDLQHKIQILNINIEDYKDKIKKITNIT